MLERAIYKVRTFHGTIMFLNESLNLSHRSAVNVPDEYIPIYASLKDDGVLLFFVKDEQINYIQDFVDSQNYFFGAKPVVIGVIQNDDGSMSFKQGNRFWSARHDSERLDLRSKAMAWEHLFLDEAEVTFDDLIASDKRKPEGVANMADKEIYRIGTIHNTEVFVTAQNKVRHLNVEDVPPDDMPLYAVFEGDGVILFYIKNEQLNYVQGITNNEFIFGNNPVVIDIIRNEDNSVSFKQNDVFLSARQRTGTFDLRPQNLAWEHFTLVKTEFLLFAVNKNTPETQPTMLHNHHKVSIVIPVSDGVDTASTLDSIVKQTLKDYEIILVDGLRAESIAITDAIKNKLGDKLSIIKTGANVNTFGAFYDIGINAAVGRYVMLMGGDDELEPEALEKMYSTAERMNAEAIWCTEVEMPVKVRFDVADRVRKFAAGEFGMTARGRLLKREFLLSNRIEFPCLRAADEIVYSFYLACLAQNYVLMSNKWWRLGTEIEERADDLSFFMVTNEAFEVLDKFMNTHEFFKNSSEYKYIVLDCINEHCKKYLRRDNLTPYEFYEAVLKEVKENRVMFNRSAFLAYNFCTANWQYAQLLKKEREIKTLNAEIKKIKEAQPQKEK